MADADFLRANDAARRFGVHRDTLALWAKDGLIGRSKVNAGVWYRASDIADLIASHETKRTVVPMAAPTSTVPDVDPDLIAEFWGHAPARRAGGKATGR